MRTIQTNGSRRYAYEPNPYYPTHSTHPHRHILFDADGVREIIESRLRRPRVLRNAIATFMRGEPFPNIDAWARLPA